MNKDKDKEKVELSAEAAWALQERMIEKELMKVGAYATLIKTLIDFDIRGIRALQFITTYSAYAEKENNNKNE